MTEIVDGETGEVTSGEVVYYNTPAPVTLFGSNDPADVIVQATKVADALKSVIVDKHLYKTIGQKNHVLVEGWTLLGSMTGVFPVVEWTRPINNGWEARVEARTRGGEIIGAAEAMCTRDEKTWANRDDYALRSMAQTRATSRALRGPLGFIVELAGYSATAAEEMPAETAPNPSASGNDTKLATEKQRGMLFAVIAELENGERQKPPPLGHASWENYTKWVTADRWKLESRAELNRGQISWLIDHLKEGAPPF